MTAETVAKALGGRKAGQGWTARCPAHDDRKPSFSIRDADGKVLVRCHAGRSTIPASDTSVEACLAARGLTLQAGVLKSTKIGCRRLVSVASIENLDKVAV